MAVPWGENPQNLACRFPRRKLGLEPEGRLAVLHEMGDTNDWTTST
jgi:hypothetical protein